MIEVTISDYIKPPINMTLNVVVDLILHWRLNLFHEALARPIAKMCTQGVAGPYTHVSLDEVVYWSGALVVDSPPTFTVYMASEKLVYHRVSVAANKFDNFMLNASEFMGHRVTESNVARSIGLSQSTLTRTLGRAGPNEMGRMEPAKDCNKLKMIEDFVRLHTAECFANIGAVLMAATPPKRGATAADGTIIKKPRTNLSMVAQQFIDAYKTAYISLKNNPGGRQNLFKKILATAETRKEELHCGGWDTEVIKRRLKNQTMLDKKRERAEAEESESA